MTSRVDCLDFVRCTRESPRRGRFQAGMNRPSNVQGSEDIGYWVHQSLSSRTIGQDSQIYKQFQSKLPDIYYGALDERRL